MNQQPPQAAGASGVHGTSGGEITVEIEPYALEYVRRMLASTIAWYDNADKKAQVILTTNGAFLTFLIGSVFNPSAHWERTFNRLGLLTWALLIAMCICLAGSILCALKSLRSQLDNLGGDEFLAENGVRRDDWETLSLPDQCPGGGDCAHRRMGVEPISYCAPSYCLPRAPGRLDR